MGANSGRPRDWMAVRAFGVSIEIGFDDEATHDAAASVLPPGSAAGAPSLPAGALGAPGSRFSLTRVGAEGYAVSSGERPVTGPVSLHEATGVLDAEIRGFVATHAQGAVFVHAGTVAHRGRALVLPGASLAGKTTLVVALVRAGATYFSDEYAVLDAQGQVHPYPKPLSVRRGDGSGSREVPVADLGGTVGRASAAVAVIAITSYRAGASWRPVRRSSAVGALTLLCHAGAARRAPAAVLAAVRGAALNAVVLEGERGEAPAAAQELLALL